MIRVRFTSQACLCALALIAGCGDDGASNGNPDATVQPPPDAMEMVPDAPSPDAPVSMADCDNLPPVSMEITTLTHVPDSEDFTFDADGNLVNIQIGGGGLFKTPYVGQPQVVSANLSTFARGQRYLPDGNLVFADPDTNTLKRIDPSGAVDIVIAGLPDPNGVAIGRDGFVYLTHGGGQVRRIDPTNGEFSVLVSDSGRSFDGIAFSPDYQTLYFNEENGRVNQMPVQDDGTAGPESVLATIPITFLLDGMTTDECGNLYVVEMAGQIWRITPDGSSEVVITLGESVPVGLIPAVNFGSGIGNWRNDTLYIMDFMRQLYEVNVGVRGKPEPFLDSGQ